MSQNPDEPMVVVKRQAPQSVTISSEARRSVHESASAPANLTEQDKITTESNLASLGKGYFGICAFGGVIWIVLAMDSAIPAVMLSVGVGMILTGAMVFYGLRLLIGMSHSLRLMVHLLKGELK